MAARSSERGGVRKRDLEGGGVEVRGGGNRFGRQGGDLQNELTNKGGKQKVVRGWRDEEESLTKEGKLGSREKVCYKTRKAHEKKNLNEVVFPGKT